MTAEITKHAPSESFALAEGLDGVLLLQIC